MNIQTFYEMVGGNYSEVMSRLVTEQRVKKYLLKLPGTGDFDGAVNAWKAQEWADLFRFTHNIKGISLNLGLTELASAASDACELVRHGAPETSPDAAMEKLKKIYTLVCDSVELLD